jgi:hypothetical protein
MANYKRGYCRYRRFKPARGSWRCKTSLNGYPAAHDIIFHTRPQRRVTRQLEHRITRGADPDDIAWPLLRKPHIYYW